jgi:peptide/nickel transport system permease protein
VGNYIVGRVLIAIPTLFGITVLIFIVMRVLPGDPIALIQTENAGQHVLTPEEADLARHSLGLDRPYYVQYLSWMGDVFTGKLGESFWRGEPIRNLILRRAPISGEIAIVAILISWLIGVPAGVFSARRRNSTGDWIARTVMTIFIAVPSFWSGLVIVLVGILMFTWRPPIQIIYPWDDLWGNVQIVIGPAFVLGLGVAAVTGRITRATVLEVMQEDYVRTARAKGATANRVVWRHAFRNAVLPIVTLSGLTFGGLLGGSVAVERAFGVPGLGQALIQALSERDWMVVQNLVLLYGVIFTVMNLLVDVAYGWLDPRIRYQ